MESYPLIATIVAALVGAFIFGSLAKYFKLPSILGYLVAGVLIGPHTPGMIADVHLASQLADLGIILLMFGVGLHLSVADLLRVRHIALPGVLLEALMVPIIGFLFVSMQGYPPIEGFVFGFCLSVASTVVLLRSLEQRNGLRTESGQIAIGWLIVEDIVTVMAIVLLPVIAGFATNTAPISLADTFNSVILVIGKVSVFALGMLFIGKRFLPMLLVRIAKFKSRELTSLGTLAIALGFAYVAYVWFDASFALGAFLAGLVLNESEIGQKAAEQTLPLRDTFSVLFFVSAGMLFDPTILLSAPVEVLGVLAIIMIGKSSIGFIVSRWRKESFSVALLVGVSIAQIGEFSFVLAGMGRSLNVLSEHLYNLVLAGAILSIALNAFLFRFADDHIRARNIREIKKAAKTLSEYV